MTMPFMIRSSRMDVSDLAPMVTWGPILLWEWTSRLLFQRSGTWMMNGLIIIWILNLAKTSRHWIGLYLYRFLYQCASQRFGVGSQVCERQKIAPNLTAIVVPGSRPVKQAAEKLGLDKIFMDAGFEWRDPGCSMCLGMNPDKVPDGVHCASTSNRNFEDRQGFGAKTHLCSPAMAAAAAITGRFVDVRQMPEVE